MTGYIVTIWDATGGEHFLAADDKLTACEACALRFTDPALAEAAAIRNTPQGGAYAIEEEEV